MVSHAQRATPEAPPVQWTRINDFDTQHVALDLHFDWKTQKVGGAARLTLKPVRSDLSRLVLDAGEPMRVFSVKTETGAALDYTHNKAAEKLIITLDRRYRRDEPLTLEIAYEATATPPKGGLFGVFGTGLTFIQPTPERPNRPRQIWSQGETEYNRNWFPCFDFPSDKFTSELRATVETSYIVVSNGRLVADTDNGDGTHTVHWRMEQPHASYLLAVAVGEYRVIEGEYDGIPVQSYVYPNRYEDARRAFANLPHMMAFFSQETGVRYPYAKYAQTMVAEFGGGMENITTTHLSDAMLPRRNEPLDGVESLQAHELAHQWFGNLVTCRDWSEIWLSEGFATYFEALYMGARFGEARLRSIMEEHHATYHTAWNQGRQRPIVTRRFTHPDELFDAYAYSRGALVLDMLRYVVGDEAWRRGVALYLTRHQFQNVETHDFRRAMEDASGMGLDWFFDQWVYRMGHPVFTVSHRYSPKRKRLTVTIRQSPARGLRGGFPQAEFFRTPADVEIVWANGVSRLRWMIEAQAEQSFSVEAPTPPRAVRFDPDHRLIRELAGEPTATRADQQGDLEGRFQATAGCQCCQQGRRQRASATPGWGGLHTAACNPHAGRVGFPYTHYRED
ncbi:MAG: M1 family metallopeptidase [Chloracidobacterium sp.]|nr:M1 family metallopeptidase [Chloracidobacterium sp.]MDW8218412.1 M1 family metallopeptidase [Acidobacteriota bacterium]